MHAGFDDAVEDGLSSRAVKQEDGVLELFSVGGGRYSRVFVGLVPGWNAGAETAVTAEDIAANLDAIRDQSDYIVPERIADEMRQIASGLGG